MKNQQLIRTFLDGETKGDASNLYITGSKLVNYNTTIAERVDNIIIVNVTKYSATSTVNQNILLKELRERNMPYTTVNDIKQNTFVLKGANQ